MGERNTVKRIFSQSKAQISLFIVIGVILLITIVTFLIFQSESTKLDPNIIPQISDNAEVAIIQSFVTSCVDELSEDALLLAGQQGGYTDLSTVGASTSFFNPTESDGFTFTENSQIQIPYWHYLLSPNDCPGDCLFFSQRPRLTGQSARSVEQQIKTYLNRNLATCLADFTAFDDQGYTITEDFIGEQPIDLIDGVSYPFEFTVLFREDDVKVNLNYPLTIEKNGFSETIDLYSSVVDVPFKRMYTLASVLTAVELEHRYTEAQIIEMISLNSGIDRDKLPPLGGSTNEFVSTMFWLVSDVESKVQEILTVYTGALRVKGTKNYREITFPDSAAKPALDKAFANMVIPLNEETNVFQDINVNYEYLSWPYYFNINNDNGLIKPDSLSIDFFPFFGIQRFRHYYDVSNPIRVALTHDEARSGEGFTFAFGLENNIRNNAPMWESYEDYVNPYADGGADYGVEAVQQTLVCNPDQRNTEEITITVLDEHTKAPIDEAAITFTCGDETCTIGSTDETGTYTGSLPICGGATITAFKGTGVRSYKTVSTSLDYSTNIKLPIETIVDKEISVQKLIVVKEFPRKNAEWVLGRYTDLDIAEQVVITATRLEENTQGSPHTATAVISGASGPDEVVTMGLLPGKYEVEIQSIIDEEVFIPESRRSEKGEDYVIDAILMEQFPAGHLSLTGETKVWKLKESELYGDNTIQFYFPASDLINVLEVNRVVEDLQKPQEVIDDLIDDNITLLMPKIIKN